MHWQISKADSFDLDGSYCLHRGAFVLMYGTPDECRRYLAAIAL